MITRRDLCCWGTNLLGGLMTLGLAVPGVGYLLDPVFRGRLRADGFRSLTRLGELLAGVPRMFPIIAAREDAWVSYPPEPIGSVWLVRQPEGTAVPVIAYTAECPHLGCAVVPGRGRTRLLLSLPSEPVRPPGPAVERGATAWDGPAGCPALGRFRSSGPRQVPTVSDSEPGEDTPCLGH